MIARGAHDHPMEIIRRDVHTSLDADAVPRDWCAGDPFETTFLSALSLLFPEGEKFFVESVKQHRHVLSDPELLRAVAGFIGQEAMHGREHRAFNELLVAHGHPCAPGVDRWLKGFLVGVRRILSPASQLAVTTALEHFTAMLAEALLAREDMRGDFHESMQPLWLWHALEESEHKAVAFDVYTAAGGTYARRVAIMMLTTAVFFAVTAGVQLRMLRERRLPPWKWLHGIRRLWIYPGLLTRLTPAWLQYFRPGFHPNDRDTTALLEQWREILFPARAA